MNSRQQLLILNNNIFCSNLSKVLKETQILQWFLHIPLKGVSAFFLAPCHSIVSLTQIGWLFYGDSWVLVVDESTDNNCIASPWSLDSLETLCSGFWAFDLVSGWVLIHSDRQRFPTDLGLKYASHRKWR